jgi:retron-type reverse transcriptase
MNQDIDVKLLAAFTHDQIVRAFFEYKYAKWDHFSGVDNPEINIPVGADGITMKGFEKQLSRHAKNICQRIQENTYIFYPFREVDKEKLPRRNPREYRPLSIASIRDALVQNILYKSVIYEPLEALFHSLDHPYPVSYAYRKGMSAPKAAEMIQHYIKSGYTHVLDADLTAFFDSIPHDRLLSRLAREIGDQDSVTMCLVKRFIHADKVPFVTYRHYKYKDGNSMGYRIFHNTKPKRKQRTAGVPQGGVLSGILANLYLHDFDDWVIRDLRQRFDLQYVRYADDFIIMVKLPDLLPVINSEVAGQMKNLGLTLNIDKTILIDVCEKGLDFVGFHFDGKRISAKKRNIECYEERVRNAIQTLPDYVINQKNPTFTLKRLVWRVNAKVLGRHREEPCPRCGCKHIGSDRSWMAFFQGVTDLEQLKKVDRWTRKQIYDRVYQLHKYRVSRKELRGLHLKSLVNQRYSMANKRLYPCLCEIDQQGLWTYAEDIYKCRSFETLHRNKTFYVKTVNDQEIVILVNRHEYHISKDVFNRLWIRLKSGNPFSRAALEKEGIRNTSQVVALLARLPAVTVHSNPIRLTFDGYQPADFMKPK